jgi:ferritin-like metal-binding protein YciE
LLHEVQDLISAEEQIIEAMPAMIEKAQNPLLKKALEEHLRITEKQRKRLDEVQNLMESGQEEEGENKGFLSGLLDKIGGKQTCKGMEGIITEGQKILKADMDPAVMDAAIIAAAQKVEHYEICGYGTVKAYARELGLDKVAELFEETLDEEYEADDRLTDLAVGSVNEKAEKGGNKGSKAAAKKSSGASGSNGKSNSSAGSKVAARAGNNGSKAASNNSSGPKKAANTSSGGTGKKAATKASSAGAGKKAAAKTGAAKKAAAKKGR